MVKWNNRSKISYKLLIPDSITGIADEKSKWRWPSYFIFFWICVLIFSGMMYSIDFFQLEKYTILTRLSKNREILHNDILGGYVINTPGCRIPEMNPFDSHVKPFIQKEAKLVCNKGIPPLFDSNLTALFVVNNSLPYYNIRDIAKLQCCYKEFWREEPSDSQADKVISYNKNCVNISNTVLNIEEEFIQVTCKNSSEHTIYEDYFAFVPIKNKTDLTFEKKPINVLVMGLDAVSRVNFHRQMPITSEYLLKELNAIEFLGYTKVADNTFVNLMPVLAGMFESELQHSCWPNQTSRFDDCHFVWHDFKDKNYITAFGEDCAWIGLFSYQKLGFIKQSLHYYYPYFNREAETRIGNDQDFNCDLCTGGRESYKVTLDYIKKFVLRMKMETLPYFGFFWGTSLSHDYLNKPSLGDLSYYELFKTLKNNGHLDNTILIFMSDHGIRWGDIRQTYQGRMEERLPFVFMVLPEWFKEQHSNAVINLNKNSRKLTTPFDLHETLKDLVDPEENLKNVEHTANFSESTRRGYSLFDEIPKSRTCKDAAIDSHWCTCQLSTEVNPNDTEVKNAAAFAVSHINSQLIGYAQCATLQLNSIINARIMSYGDHILNGHIFKEYTITLKTMPGEAIFEMTVRITNDKNNDENSKDEKTKAVQDKQLAVTGTVSRLNLYGSQSYCITDFHLKLYCYCNSLLHL